MQVMKIVGATHIGQGVFVGKIKQRVTQQQQEHNQCCVVQPCVAKGGVAAHVKPILELYLEINIPAQLSHFEACGMQ
jgi:hypothetical protein